MDNTKLLVKRIGIIVILVISLICFICGISAVYGNNINNKEHKLDIRFLVDASYSMKKDDPNNLRIRALQRIIKKLPDDARSGVWTYGKYVNMLIPLGVTNSVWKKRAIYGLEKINGYGNNRNLSSAIETASYGWQQKNDGYKKYIVVLTDSGSDFADLKSKSAQTRQMLLTNTIAKLKKAGIQIHVISLSKNSDNRMLKVLASQTGGNWYAAYNIELLSEVMHHVYGLLTKSGFKPNSMPKAKIVAEIFKRDLEQNMTPIVGPVTIKGDESKDFVKNNRRVTTSQTDNKNNLPVEINDQDWLMVSSDIPQLELLLR